jgi:hypothetical protein
VAYGLASAIHNLIKSFWSVSGIANDVGYPFAAIGIVFMMLSFVGLFLWLTGVQRHRPLSSHPPSPLFASLAVAIAMNVCLVLRFGYVNGMGQGRHLFVLLFPVALVLAVGSRSLALQNSAARVAGFWITYSVAFTVFSLCRFPH